MSIQENHLKAIADAIREKDGTTAPIPAADFPTRIQAIPTGGGSCSPSGLVVVGGVCKEYQSIKGAI